ncbi:MAG: methyltransferase domain-containing protein [Candidatus Pacebacteria bacterium]|nr:methyltransferase domain-containing protein [Candidatus Paceibacterota bacterium]
MNTPTAVRAFSQDDWNDYARCYDSLAKLTPYVEMVKGVAQKVLLGERGPILDAACGTGNFESSLLSEQIHQTFQATGVDSSQAMLRRARRKCEKYEGVSFIEADLNVTLPFGNETFKQLVSINTLYAVSSPRDTLLEFGRVLQKGGVLHLVTPKYGYENGLILKSHCGSSLPDDFWTNAHATPEREEFLIREAISDEGLIEDMLSAAKYNRLIGRTGIFHFFKEEDLIDLLSRTSFSVVRSSLTYADQALFITATKI